MKVELLWFSGCPNGQETDARLREAVSLAGVDADVVLVEVTTPDDAERLRFRGSPTVLVDGTDPFAQESDPVGLSCRVFRTPDGLRGAPTVEQLVSVLRGAA
ncbi:MAG: thioredoxin family protein [Mycobacteriales bacterium]|nr:thioredoxin family protein [Mycobacteriales bacterium]